MNELHFCRLSSSHLILAIFAVSSSLFDRMECSVRVILRHLLASTLLLSTPYMIWKGVSVLSNTSHPLMVVISESMAPAFRRGDILFISNRTEIAEIGQIPVCWFADQPMPMVHRAVKILNEHRESDGVLV